MILRYWLPSIHQVLFHIINTTMNTTTTMNTINTLSIRNHSILQTDVIESKELLNIIRDQEVECRLRI